MRVTPGKLVLWTAVMAVGVAWDIYDIATATEAPNQAVAVMTYVFLAGMLMGLVIGLIGLVGLAVKSMSGNSMSLMAAACIAAAMMRAGPALADASAAAALTECDRLAAHPNDPGREGPGVAFDKIDAAAAIGRCTEALAGNPNHTRVLVNLGRANQRAGRFDEAVRLYKLAAGQGYRAAQYNLGFFYENGRGGLARDESEAARLYKLAADQDTPKPRPASGFSIRMAAAGWPRTTAKPPASTSSPPIRGMPGRSTTSASSTMRAAAGWPRTSARPSASSSSPPRKATKTPKRPWHGGALDREGDGFGNGGLYASMPGIILSACKTKNLFPEMHHDRTQTVRETGRRQSRLAQYQTPLFVRGLP